MAWDKENDRWYLDIVDSEHIALELRNIHNRIEILWKDGDFGSLEHVMDRIEQVADKIEDRIYDD